MKKKDTPELGPEESDTAKFRALIKKSAKQATAYAKRAAIASAQTTVATAKDIKKTVNYSHLLHWFDNNYRALNDYIKVIEKKRL